MLAFFVYLYWNTYYNAKQSESLKPEEPPEVPEKPHGGMFRKPKHHTQNKGGDTMGWLSRLFGGGKEEPETATSAEDTAAPTAEEQPVELAEEQTEESAEEETKPSVEE
jgi:hypothetical protein